MAGHPTVPSEVLARVRSVCLALPEAYEEPAWVGIRWRIRQRTFADVLTIDDGWPPAYARAAATQGPAVVLTFESAGVEVDALRHAGPPYFKPRWRRDVIGVALDGDVDVDWDELAELLTESYCTMAPKKLVALVERPRDAD